MQTYTYTVQDGWSHAGPARALPGHIDDSERLGDWLYDQGFRRLAESGRGRCDVGHFFLWHTDEPGPDWPRWGIEVDQVGAESLVWIDSLPDLWDFLSQYGSIGYAMATLWGGDEEPACPDCGEPMTRVSPLRLLPARPGRPPGEA